MRIHPQLPLLTVLLIASAASAAAPAAHPASQRQAALAAATAKAQALMPDVRTKAGLPSTETFTPHRALIDQLGQAHVRFQQYHQGVKVMGAEAVMHFDAEGNALEPTAGHLASIAADTSVQPGVTSDRALALTLKDLKAKGEVTGKTVELVMHPNISGPQSAVKRTPDGRLLLDLPMTTFGRSSSTDPFILAYHV
ncbi:MAG TPA: hypothetical protein VJ483_09870, partial [Holophagaceae bacterium]|nr:hypothetical protein [Holophagaceae bacterium]